MMKARISSKATSLPILCPHHYKTFFWLFDLILFGNLGVKKKHMGQSRVKMKWNGGCNHVDREYQKGGVDNCAMVFKELKLETKRKGDSLCPWHTPERHTDVHLSEVKCWFGESLLIWAGKNRTFFRSDLKFPSSWGERLKSDGQKIKEESVAHINVEAKRESLLSVVDHPHPWQPSNYIICSRAGSLGKHGIPVWLRFHLPSALNNVTFTLNLYCFTSNHYVSIFKR